jgi:hypothetical protein
MFQHPIKQIKCGFAKEATLRAKKENNVSHRPPDSRSVSSAARIEEFTSPLRGKEGFAPSWSGKEMDK